MIYSWLAFIAFLSDWEGELFLWEAEKVTLGSTWCEPNGEFVDRRSVKGGSIMVGVGELHGWVQVKKLQMDLSWHALNSMLQVKILYHTEKQRFGYLWLSKKIQTYPPKPSEAEPSFGKVNLPPEKLHMLFHTDLWVRESWPQIYSLWQALDWGLLFKILASTKIGRA